MASPATRRLQVKLDRALQTTKRLRQKSGEAVVTVVETAEVSGTAFLFGLIQGRMGAEKSKLFGLPIDLLAGTGLHLLTLLGVGNRASPHMRAMGNGALASYFHTVGRGQGVIMKTRAGTAVSGTQADRGLPPRSKVMAGGAYVEDDELVDVDY